MEGWNELRGSLRKGKGGRGGSVFYIAVITRLLWEDTSLVSKHSALAVFSVLVALIE